MCFWLCIAIFLAGIKILTLFMEQSDLANLWFLDEIGDITLSAATAIFGALFCKYFDTHYKICYIVFHNLSQSDITIFLGDAMDRRCGYGQGIVIGPNNAVCRKVKCLSSLMSTSRPCAKIAYGNIPDSNIQYLHSNSVPLLVNSNGNDATQKQVLLFLWEPNENYLSKLFEITNEEIKEIRNPGVRKWHNGDCDIHQVK